MAVPAGAGVLRAAAGRTLSVAEVGAFVSAMCREEEFRNRRVLLIIPDGTRTAPVGMLFRAIVESVGRVTAALDVMVALGTHPPMSEEAICRRLEITPEERRSRWGRVAFFNHEWDNPSALATLGTLGAEEIDRLSGGRFAMEVPVRVNRRLLEYDLLLIVGPVFPHEIVGFSGGNKYLFPGVGGAELLDFFHWLGAVTGNVNIIGTKATPVRKVVDRAGAMVPVERRCFALVVNPTGPDAGGLLGLYHGTPESAWSPAADHSSRVHIEWRDRPFHTIVSCAPPMYDELWVGGKCMYKLEPVLADGGELIIVAPHLRAVSETHGRTILEVGYHCQPYFEAQWERFRRYPWGVLAHCAYVYGAGTFRNGVERPRARVTLATGLSAELCGRINLGYRDHRSLQPEAFAGREGEGVLLVPKAGEILYKLASHGQPDAPSAQQ